MELAISANSHYFITKLYSLLESHQAEEVLVNGRRGIYAVCADATRRIEGDLPELSDCADAVRQMARDQGLRLDARHPSCGGSITHLGLRWQAMVSPVAEDELVFSLRKHRFLDLSLKDFVWQDGQRGVLENAVARFCPILIAGATGAGKSSFLISLLKEWHLDRRVIITESVSELATLSDTWIKLCEVPAQVSGHGAFPLSSVARETLRLRPEILVIGEIRGEEAEVFLDMSLSGHGGCLATIHAESPIAAMIRLNAMAPKMRALLPKNFACTVVQLRRTAVGVTVEAVQEVAWGASSVTSESPTNTGLPH